MAKSFIFKTSPICVNEVKYLRQVLYVCHELYKTRNSDQNLQRNNVARQVEGFCISYFAASGIVLRVRHLITDSVWAPGKNGGGV